MSGGRRRVEWPEPSRSWTVPLAVAGGLATETAFPGRSWWPMAYVGVALLLLALRRDSARWGLVVGFVYGLAFFLPHVWWANEAVGQPIGWVALSVLQAAYLAAFGAAWVWVRRGAWVRERAWLRVVGVAVLWGRRRAGPGPLALRRIPVGHARVLPDGRPAAASRPGRR